jgi:hypothetical protein
MQEIEGRRRLESKSGRCAAFRCIIKRVGEPQVATLGKVPHRRIVFSPVRSEVFPTGVAARLDSGEPSATTTRGPRCAHRPPSRSGSRDHELGLWYFPVEK